MAPSKMRIAVVTALTALGAMLFSVSAAQGQTAPDTYACQFTGVAGTVFPDESVKTNGGEAAVGIVNGQPVPGAGIVGTGNDGVEGPPTEMAEQVPGNTPPRDAEVNADENVGPDTEVGGEGAPTAVNDVIDNRNPGGGRYVGDDEGKYTFGPVGNVTNGTCTFVDGDVADPIPPNNTDGTQGVYCATITSGGRYENIVAGTGTATGNEDGNGPTTVHFFNPPAGGACGGAAGTSADGAAEGPANAEYHIGFIGGSGALNISSITGTGADAGDTGTGAGHVNISATVPGGIAPSGDVTSFQVNGGFMAAVQEAGP